MTPAAPLVEPHWVDFCIVGLLVLSGIIGVMRGLTREVLSLGCWAGAVALSRSFYPVLRHELSPWIKNPQLLDPVAMALIFISAMIILSLLVRWIASFIKTSLLGGLDRTLGLVFGLLRGSVILWVVYAGIIFIFSERPGFFQKARLEPVLAWGSVQILKWVPLESLVHFSPQNTQKLFNSPIPSQAIQSQHIFQTLMQSIPKLPSEETSPAPEETPASLPESVQDFLEAPVATP